MAEIAKSMNSKTGKKDKLDKDNSHDNKYSGEWQRRPQHVDTGIVIVIMLLLAFGLVMLFSASMSVSLTESNTSTRYLVRQFLASAIGVAIMFLLSKFNIKVFDKLPFAVIAYMLSLVLLALTLFTTPVNGAKRWLSVPLFGTFQPSELTKVVMVYAIACYESWLVKQRAMGKFTREPGFKGALKDAFMDILLPVFFLMLPVAVMAMQPHMSGIIILLFISFAALLAAGLPWRSWLTAGIIIIALAAVFFTALFQVWDYLPKDLTGRFAHVFTRLAIFKGSDTVTEDEIYQTNQALIAIGSGGLTGVGLGQGKQKARYLPEVHNDYIYSSIIEETGLVGGLFVIALFLIFFVLGMKLAHRANSVYAQIIATGISSLITLQAVLNIAVNVGAIPPTGISLPFFSYGGTSNMFFLIGVGLLLNVSKYGVRADYNNSL